MELTFIGRGAAFNTKEGNTSAYFIENKELFLIDCGESIFERIIKYNILNNINKINILITHTHSDHIGSIGSLISYAYYVLNIKVNIILPSIPEYLNDINSLLKAYNCKEYMYTYTYDYNYTNKYKSFNSIKYIKTKHVEGLSCYSIIFNTNKGLIYYSGDTKEIDTLKELIKNNNIYKIYIDTTTNNTKDNVHLYIGIIEKEIPDNLKSKVYCMHINNDECISRIKSSGMNIVEINKRV